MTGGHVYRGRSLGDRFRGRYFFADFVSGRVWSLALAVSASTGEATASDVIDHTSDLGGASVTGNISSFGIDAEGELYLVSHSRGLVLRLVGGLNTPGSLHIVR